ncbi:MAG: glycine betaine ABC transporter substrate-binding protein [Shinella sp.]|nr:glycine betaine ABC transporter substrate-binding protein [Shinella sp.]
MKMPLAWIFMAAGFFTGGGSAEAADCGSVSIAEMNWGSAGVAAHVDKLILEKGFGCTVTLVPGDTIPTFTSMNEKGEPDVAPELWVNSVTAALDAAIAEKRLIELAPILSEGGVEGWWIPKFVYDRNRNIRTVEDALKHPELFPAPDGSSKGAVHNCPAGWSCQVSTENLFRAVGAQNAGFELVGAATAAQLDASIARAFETETGWLGYYWAPTAILGKYDMVKLSFGVEHDKAEWDSCTAVADCPAPKVNSYPTSDAYTVVTKAFAEKAAPAMNYMRARQWTNATIGKVLAWMDENKAGNEEGAKHFLREYPDTWMVWVGPDVAAKVEAAVK